MPKYVIEREIPDVGKLSREQLQAISQKSCAVLSNLGPQIQWVESYVMDDKIYCFRSPRHHRSDHCRIAGALNRFCKAVVNGPVWVPFKENGATIKRWLLLPRQSAKQKHAQHDKENIREPDE